jgi:cytochrome b561
VTSITSPRPSTITILRFDAVQRTVHWLNALMFLTLMFTGLPLYFGSFFGVVFPRHAIQMVHLWTGLALPLPVAIALVGPWGLAPDQPVDPGRGALAAHLRAHCPGCRQI